MTKPYNRIPCQVYDHFEIAAMRKKIVSIRYKEENANEQNLEDVIVDLKSIDKVEYAIFKTGKSIRLDWIIQLDDLVIQDVKGCYL